MQSSLPETEAGGGLSSHAARVRCGDQVKVVARKVPTLTARGQHGRGDYDRHRAALKMSRKWYASARWKALRALQLAREPLCRFHWQASGVTVVATVADHVVPHREDARLFWEGELQSLCATCHSSTKQRQERLSG